MTHITNEPDAPRRFVARVRAGDLETVRGLLSDEPALASTHFDGATALHWAAWDDEVDVARLLVENGANLDAEDDRHSMLPIAWANEHGHMEMVRTLSELGARVPLQLAAAFGLIDRLRTGLEEEPGRVDEPYRYGTALQYAALWGQPAAVELLLQAGANTAVTDERGSTPLAVARAQTRPEAERTSLVVEPRKEQLRAGCAEVVRLLTEAGALDRGPAES